MTKTYGYDFFRRLVSYSDGNTTAKYEYNADNLRTAKTVGNTRTDYVWDGANVMYEYGGTTQSYAYDMTGIIQSGTDTYLKDAHGSVVGKYSSAGVSLGAASYEAFGNALSTTLNDPFGYCGEYRDSESGLIYLRNRYYDPNTGRFITEDPAKDGMNWYSYCAGNPVNAWDPWGLFDYDDKLSYNQTYNEDVVALQERLVELGYMNAPADGEWGYFGSKTLSAVNQYKDDTGLWNFGEYEGVVGLTTWQSLGLIYRTQGDIDRGVSISLVGRKQYFDVTKMFNDQLWYAEQYLKSLFPIGQVQYEWLKKVNHGGEWDIKRRSSWDKTFGGSYPGAYDAKIVLYGSLSTPEKMGNIFYGYTGSVIHISEMILLAGSVYAAGTGGTLNDFSGVCAELSDWTSIQTGVRLYYEKHPLEIWV